jgi:hypothetical protein
MATGIAPQRQQPVVRLRCRQGGLLLSGQVEVIDGHTSCTHTQPGHESGELLNQGGLAAALGCADAQLAVIQWQREGVVAWHAVVSETIGGAQHKMYWVWCSAQSLCRQTVVESVYRVLRVVCLYIFLPWWYHQQLVKRGTRHKSKLQPHHEWRGRHSTSSLAARSVLLHL